MGKGLSGLELAPEVAMQEGMILCILCCGTNVVILTTLSGPLKNRRFGVKAGKHRRNRQASAWARSFPYVFGRVLIVVIGRFCSGKV